MLFTVVGSARSHTPTIRFDMSSASRPLYVQITLTIGILMSGKMSVGVVTIEATPKIAISSATMTNVYGLFRANRTIHIKPFSLMLSCSTQLATARDGRNLPSSAHVGWRRGEGNPQASNCYREYRLLERRNNKQQVLGGGQQNQIQRPVLRTGFGRGTIVLGLLRPCLVLSIRSQPR